MNPVYNQRHGHSKRHRSLEGYVRDLAGVRIPPENREDGALFSQEPFLMECAIVGVLFIIASFRRLFPGVEVLRH